MSKKDRTPVEIAEIRRQRERKRIMRGLAIWVAWLAIFTVGSVLDSGALMWFAFALSMANIVVINGLHERTLRRIADRPLPDYNRIRKLEKRELPTWTTSRNG